jgi:hypothetical protein
VSVPPVRPMGRARGFAAAWEHPSPDEEGIDLDEALAQSRRQAGRDAGGGR